MGWQRIVTKVEAKDRINARGRYKNASYYCHYLNWPLIHQRWHLCHTFNVFIEDGNSVWFLQETGIEATDLNGVCITWVPRPESILEDGLLMIALYIVKNKEIVENADKYLHSAGGDKADLNTDIKLENLEFLHSKFRNLSMGKKLAITVMEGSAIGKQLQLLENYNVSHELFTPQYTRRPQDQGYEYTVTGSLKQATYPTQIRH